MSFQSKLSLVAGMSTTKQKCLTTVIAGGQRKRERWRPGLLTEQVAVFVKRESLGKFSLHLPPRPAVMYPQLPRETLSTLSVCHCFQLSSFTSHVHTSYGTCWHHHKCEKKKVWRVWGRSVIGCHSWTASYLRHSRWREERLSLYWAGLWTDTRFTVPLGYSSLSIGGIESGECNKSFNGGPAKSFSVDFKDSLHEAMDCFEFFGPGVCLHRASCKESSTTACMVFILHTRIHAYTMLHGHKLRKEKTHAHTHGHGDTN